MIPGYNFDRKAVAGLTGSDDLDGLAAEQAFVLINESDIVEHTNEADDPTDPADWFCGKRLSWKLGSDEEASRE